MLMRFAAVVLSCALCAGPTAALGWCFDEAARTYQVNPQILRAIAFVESTNNPKAVRRNDNGAVDIGLMQINSDTLQDLGYGQSAWGHFFEPCTNVRVAAWKVRREMNRYGNTWDAIGAYHSRTPELRRRYAHKIYNTLATSKPVGQR